MEDKIPLLPNYKDKKRIEYFRGLGLTPCEAEVASLVCEGVRNQIIADFLNIKVKTVKYHLTNAYAKLGFSDRPRLIVMALNAIGKE